MKGMISMSDRVKFTTTLDKNVIYKLAKLAPDFGGDKNDVIERLVEKEWDSRNGMEKENRDNE
jgi:hypothetical protein